MNMEISICAWSQLPPRATNTMGIPFSFKVFFWIHNYKSKVQIRFIKFGPIKTQSKI